MKWNQLALWIWRTSDEPGSRTQEILIELALQNEARCEGNHLGQLVLALAFGDRDTRMDLRPALAVREDDLERTPIASKLWGLLHAESPTFMIDRFLWSSLA